MELQCSLEAAFHRVFAFSGNFGFLESQIVIVLPFPGQQVLYTMAANVYNATKRTRQAMIKMMA